MNRERFAAVERAIKDLRQGRMVVVTDDADREHEGDLVMAALAATPADVNLMAREGRGLICCAINAATAERLDLRVQFDERRSPLHGTAFTESVDWIHGTATGISAADRAATLQGLADSKSRSEDFARPGHLFPIVARPGGVLERGGHTEAAIDLCRLAGLPPAAAMCEIMSDDGTMAREAELAAVAERLDLVVVSIADLVSFRRFTERLVRPAASAALPTQWGAFTIHHLASSFGPSTPGPLLLTRGVTLPADQDAGTRQNPDGWPEQAGRELPPFLVRIHSECCTGDLFGSLRCDCGEQLAAALRLIGAEAEGALIYLRQEGRGIGLDAKLRAYGLQDGGLDTVDANLRLGFPADLRDYWEAAQILKLLGRPRVRLLTNNPRKVAGIEEWGIEVAEQISLRIPANPHNERYLKTKRDRLGHAV